MEVTFKRNLQELERTFRQLDTTLESAHIGSGKWKPLFGATNLAKVHFKTTGNYW